MAGQRFLFARGGTHWSYASALHVLEDVRTGSIHKCAIPCRRSKYKGN